MRIMFFCGLSPLFFLLFNNENTYEVTEGLTGGDHGEHIVMYLSHRLSKSRPFKKVP